MSRIPSLRNGVTAQLKACLGSKTTRRVFIKHSSLALKFTLELDLRDHGRDCIKFVHNCGCAASCHCTIS